MTMGMTLLSIVFIGFFVALIIVPEMLKRKKMEGLFLTLEAEGFHPIDKSQKEIIEKVEFSDLDQPLFSWGQKRKTKVLLAIAQAKETSHKRYLFYMKTCSIPVISSTATRGKDYSIKLVDICPNRLQGKIMVRQKGPAFAESILQMAMGKLYQAWGVREITQGLSENFSNKFVVMAKDSNITFPETLQSFLVKTSPQQTNNAQPACMFFSPEGFSLDEDIRNKDKLDKLLALADGIKGIMLQI